MNLLAWLRERAGHGSWRTLATVLLAAWFAGLVVAAIQLERWQGQVTHTLLQLQADAQFRARAGPRDHLDPEWYRRKALALLAAMEQMRHDGWWTVFIPGSWHWFDDLEERLSARIGREFGDIVMETLRRELLARGAALTGAPLAASSNPALQPGACSPPQAPPASAAPAPPEQLPEFAALRGYLESLQPLAESVQAWQHLHQGAGTSGPAELRKLVRYTLDAELPGPVSRSVALFGTLRPGEADPATTVEALRGAARCGLLRLSAALDRRLMERNELLALERSLAERTVGLWDARRLEPFAPAMLRLRETHDLLVQQEALLSGIGTQWMNGPALRLGPAHERLLEQASASPLLGPEVVQQARAQSEAAYARFRRELAGVLERQRPPGLVWDEARGGYVPSAQRAQLRAGLHALLQEPALQLAADGSVPPAPPSIEVALGVGELRRRWRQELLPRFPDTVRPAIARLLDGRLVVLAHDATANAIRAAVPDDLATPFDVAGFRQQREQVARVQALLNSLGAPDLAQRLATQQSAELSARLASGWQELLQLPLFAHVTDFSWWRGEPSALPRAMGVADTSALQHLLVQQFQRIDALASRASQLIAAGDPALAQDPAAQRWQELTAEVERYRMRQPDSSMLAMERYFATLAPVLQGPNCTEFLLAQSPPRHHDEVAQRLTQLNNALAQRCMQLRAPSQPDPVAVTR